MLDLSFAAFKGASGAPVIEENSGKVLGMIVGNINRHLLPAQMERVEMPDGVTQTISYFAPYGRAIRARHLKASLEAMPTTEGAT